MLELSRRLSVLFLLVLLVFLSLLGARTHSPKAALFSLLYVAKICLGTDDIVVDKVSVVGIFFAVLLFFFLICVNEAR